LEPGVSFVSHFQAARGLRRLEFMLAYPLDFTIKQSDMERREMRGERWSAAGSLTHKHLPFPLPQWRPLPPLNLESWRRLV